MMNKTLQNGYIALMTVFIISLASMTIALFMITSGVDMTKTSLSVEQSARARAYANACVEIALETIRNDTTYSGTGNRTFLLGTCSFEVLNLGGETREVRGVGLSGDITRRTRAIITGLTGNINVSDWQEIADF